MDGLNLIGIEMLITICLTELIIILILIAMLVQILFTIARKSGYIGKPKLPQPLKSLKNTIGIDKEQKKDKNKPEDIILEDSEKDLQKWKETHPGWDNMP